MELTLCIDKQDRYTPSDELKQYTIEIGNPLRSYQHVYDELTISTNDEKKLIGSITRRCYVDKFGVLKILEYEEVQELTLPEIVLFEGTNYVYIQEFSNLNMKIEYLTNSEMNKYFATKMEMNSTIKQTYDSIMLAVSKKVGNDEIVAKINMSPEQITILANKLGLTANDVLNIIAGNEINLTSKRIAITADNFSVDKDGNAIMKSGKIANFNLSDGKLTSNITIERDYTEDDINRLRSHLTGELTLTDTEKTKLDVNKDGVLDSIDYVIIRNLINSGISTGKPGKFEIDTLPNELNILNLYDGSGVLQYYIGYWVSKLKNLTTESLKTNSITVVGDANISGDVYAGDNKCVSSPYVHWLNFINNGSSTYMELNLYNPFGNVSAYGVNVWASDKRLKDNIKDSSYNALEKLKLIKHRQFDYKNGGHVSLGYVADELEEIDPDLIFEVGKDKLKQPSIDKLIPLLSRAIQEQQLQIEKLTKRVEVLENAK